MSSISELIDINYKRAQAYSRYINELHESLKVRKLLDEEIVKLQKKVSNIDKEIDTVTTNTQIVSRENESLNDEIDKLQNNISISGKKCKELTEGLIMKETDSLKLMKAKNMWRIGEVITGVRWNYSAPENIVMGYIIDKGKQLKHFEYNRDKHSDNYISNEIWNSIEATRSMDWKDIKESSQISNKENVPIKNS